MFVYRNKDDTLYPRDQVKAGGSTQICDVIHANASTSFPGRKREDPARMVNVLANLRFDFSFERRALAKALLVAFPVAFTTISIDTGEYHIQGRWCVIIFRNMLELSFIHESGDPDVFVAIQSFYASKVLVRTFVETCLVLTICTS